jgi:nanoRNase/pAp phosphatase (c-di-AMP/oligoRNAs hydrolase)
MKCSTQQALKSIKILTRINDPLEILDQTSSQGRFIHRQYDNINETYERIKSQMKSSRGKLLLSIYEDRFAITGDLANEMQHRNPDKVVMIARRNDEWMVCSIRSQNISIKEILEKSLVGIDGHGGGHEHACGAGIKHGDFPKFIENMKKNIRAATAKKSKKKS